MNTARPHCAHCAAPLDDLARRRGLQHCGAAACRQRANAAAVKSRWQQVAALAVQQATQLQPALRNALPAVLWLRPALREMEPVGDELRERLASHWRAAAHDGYRHAYEGRDSVETLPEGAVTLCAQCAGGCCVQGAGHHAFIDADVIARWQAAHPGGSVDDAIADYLARLPAEHVRGACGFQTATGCALPREARAEVCNRYVCEPLQQLGKSLAAAPQHAAVVLTADGRQLERAALLHRGRLLALQGLPGPDEIGA